MTSKTGSLLLAPTVLVTLVLPEAARAQPSQALIEARRHMLNAEINTLTFRSMEKLYETLRVDNEGQPWRLEERPAPLDFTYTFDGEMRPAEAVLEGGGQGRGARLAARATVRAPGSCRGHAAGPGLRGPRPYRPRRGRTLG